VNDIWLSNSLTAGVVTVSGGGPINSLTTGTPVAHPVFANSYDIPFVFTFGLDQLSQYSDLVAIADKYKIANVKIKAMYNATAVQGSSNSASSPSMMPIIKYVTDYDDGIMATADELNAKMGLKSKTLSEGRMVKMSVAPRVAVSVFNPSGSAYQVPNKSVYLNSANSGVPHFGIKGYLQNFTLQSSLNVTSCITFELEFTVKLRELQ